MKKNINLKNPYNGIDLKDYNVEKRRLQLELLHIQQDVLKNKKRMQREKILQSSGLQKT